MMINRVQMMIKLSRISLMNLTKNKMNNGKKKKKMNLITMKSNIMLVTNRVVNSQKRKINNKNKIPSKNFKRNKLFNKAKRK